MRDCTQEEVELKRLARNTYMREYRKKNPQKMKQYQHNYLVNQGKKILNEKGQTNND